VLDSFYSTGERDRYRTRLERVGDTTEVYISHRGMMETTPTVRDPVTIWVSRPSDPDLEAEFLTKLMVTLGTKDDQAKQAMANATEAGAKARAADAVATASPVAPTAPAKPAAGATAAPGATTLVVDDAFDRAWRRVGLGLDRSGFTVEDRDRAAGVFYVRYVDPDNLPKEENLFKKFFGTDDAGKAVRYRVIVQPNGDGKSLVSVQTAQGVAESGEVAKRIIGMLINQLK
jgi:outer membrane protein assembly factor BamC